jgi:hypothetical protein
MLTLDLVDRLISSTLVPRDAKFAAVESWRRELAAIRERRHTDRRLEQRLAEASRMLARPRPAGGGLFDGAFARGAGASV